jgi:threonine/homoserine/homoserine lactone efflux protein
MARGLAAHSIGSILMSLIAFVTAVLALLLSPGPTNTLICVAGARGGIGSSLRLLPAELAGYVSAILPLAWFGSELLGQWPFLGHALKLAAAVWVMFIAARLWRVGPGPAAEAEIGPRRVFVTTLLNPKALIFGLVLLPTPASAEFPARLAIFAALVSAVALIWGSAGSASQVGASDGWRLKLVQRLASAWLAAVSVTLIAAVFQS